MKHANTKRVKKQERHGQYCMGRLSAKRGQTRQGQLYMYFQMHIFNKYLLKNADKDISEDSSTGQVIFIQYIIYQNRQCGQGEVVSLSKMLF